MTIREYVYCGLCIIVVQAFYVATVAMCIYVGVMR